MLLSVTGGLGYYLNILQGINHDNTKASYLQNYLDEFCYKTNRKYFEPELFERLMIAATSDKFYGKFRYNYG